MFVIHLLFPFTTYGHSNTDPLSLKSEAAIVIDAKTGTVIYEKNSKVKMYPASLTKIATAIYAIENGNLDDIVTVSKHAKGTIGSSVYLEEGEQVTLKKLLQGLLINSGNDAGVAIAEHLSGSVEHFSSDINDYLQREIGVQNTNFENPHGLFDPSHVTTAEDLAKITQYAMENKVFKEIFGTKELEWNGASWDTTIYKHHKLMREMPYEGVTGGKTGFIEESGFTLATTAERENMSLIIITLNSNLQSDAYNDTINLLNYSFENFQTSNISGGTTFIVGEQEYKIPKDIFYTHHLDQKTNIKVNKEGTLNIINEGNGTVISSFQLDKINKEKELETTEEKRDDEKLSGKEKSITLSNNTSSILIIAIVVALGIAGLFYFPK